MQEFCLLCLKNGIKAKVKAYQLNLQEAVFMCTTEKCTWPAGHQDLTFISRPVGKDWSSAWDEAASKHFKNDHDPLFELSAYTPPQTPGTEFILKDTASCNVSLSTTVPDNTILNSTATISNEDVHKSVEFSVISSMPCDLPIDNSISSSMNLKPKLVVSKPIINKLEKLPAKGYVFIKSNGSNDALHKIITNAKRNGNSNISTSLVTKTLNVKNSKLIPNLAAVSPVKEKPHLVKTDLIKNGKKRTGPYEKFDFNELLKAKSTNVKKNCKINLTTVHKPNQVCIKTKSAQCIKTETKNTAEFPFDQINFIDFFESSTNVENNYNNVDMVSFDATNIDNTNSNNSPELDSILTLTSSSKDSGLDQDLMDNVDFDLSLQDLLAGFSDELTDPTKSNIDDTDESKWINALFE